MFYAAIYPDLTVSCPCQTPQTIMRGHDHFTPASYPIATAFASTLKELDPAIKECLRMLRRQWWSKLREPDWSSNA